MEEPLAQALHLVGTIELARHAPDDRVRAIGFTATEARTRLENVQFLWHALRAEVCIDTEPKPRAV
jgi:hypothetical protein